MISLIEFRAILRTTTDIDFFGTSRANRSISVLQPSKETGIQLPPLIQRSIGALHTKSTEAALRKLYFCNDSIALKRIGTTWVRLFAAKLAPPLFLSGHNSAVSLVRDIPLAAELAVMDDVVPHGKPHPI
jgi:hypothetical protein